MTACCFTILLRFKPIGKFLNTVTEVVYFSDLIDLADSCSSARILERIVCVIVLKLVCIHFYAQDNSGSDRSILILAFD
jgi:hypothetical protein